MALRFWTLPTALSSSSSMRVLLEVSFFSTGDIRSDALAVCKTVFFNPSPQCLCLDTGI